MITTPSYYARLVARDILRARLEIVEGGGHSLSKTRPEAFNRIVLGFLGAQA